MAMKNTEARIQEARLIFARPEEVTSELERYFLEVKEGVGNNCDEELERSLLARGDPLINLALARYASKEDVLAALYQKSHTTPANRLEKRYLLGLRVACLSNEAKHGLLPKFPEGILDDAEFKRLITEGDSDDVGALFSNPTIDSSILRDLYANEGIFVSLPDQRRRGLVYMSANNPRLTANEDNEFGPDMGYRGIHKAIITMLATAPATEDWRHALRGFLDKLDPGDIGWPDTPITPILERWARVPDSTNMFLKDGHYTDLTAREEFLCLVAAMYGRHWSSEGKTLSVLGAADSSELELRCAYYGCASLTEMEMQAGFARDGSTYSFAVICNSSIYSKASLRKLFEEEQLNGDLRYLYKRRCEQLHKRRSSFDPIPIADWLLDEEPLGESKELRVMKKLQETVDNVTGVTKSIQTWILWGFLGIAGLLLYLSRIFH